MGKNLLYWIFHGKVKINASPMPVVTMSVQVGNLKIQFYQILSLNRIQAFLCSVINLACVLSAIVQERLKFMIISNFQEVFNFLKSTTKAAELLYTTRDLLYYGAVSLAPHTVRNTDSTLSVTQVILTMNLQLQTTKNNNQHENGWLYISGIYTYY